MAETFANIKDRLDDTRSASDSASGPVRTVSVKWRHFFDTGSRPS